MLYNRLSDTELERAMYIDPTNTAVRDEMLGRLPVLMDMRSDEMQDLEMQLETSEKEHASEIGNLTEDLQVSERHAAELQRDLDQATDRIARIARLASAEGVV